MDVTVVVPTRNESTNVEELLRRLDFELGDLDAEILFVDDSDDDTPSVIIRAGADSSRSVRLLHREPGHRAGGSASAVVAGMRSARAPWAVVLHGDPRHPPELVPVLLDRGRTSGADLVYGSRQPGRHQTSGAFPDRRTLAATACATLARIAFPGRLKNIRDPLTDFFAVRLGAVSLATLRPVGHKILVEIAARSKLSDVMAVRYSSGTPGPVTATASCRDLCRFLQHLLILRIDVAGGRLQQLARFLAVGFSGVLINSAALWLLTTPWFHVPYLLASGAATHVAIVWNFTLLDRFAFRKVRRRSFLNGLARFWLINVALLPVQLGMLAVLVEVWSLPPVPANVGALAVIFAVRYLVTLGWVYGWRSTPASEVVAATAAPHILPGNSTPAPAASRAGRGHRYLRGHRPAPTGAPAARGPGRYLLRLALPPLATLIAFPSTVLVPLRVGISTSALLGMGAVGAAALGLTAARAAPRPGEPDVHDRQLDVILAMPLLGGATWLSLGWPGTGDADQPLSNRGVLALTLFLAGASLLLLGTRLAGRLHWVLWLPLLGLPWLADRSGLRVLLIALAITGAGREMARYRRRRRQDRTQGARRCGRSQPLPRLRASAVAVAALAMLLAGSALAATDTSATPAPQTDRHPIHHR